MGEKDFDDFLADALSVTGVLAKYGVKCLEDLGDSPETRLKMEINAEYDEFDETRRRFLEYGAGGEEPENPKNDIIKT